MARRSWTPLIAASLVTLALALAPPASAGTWTSLGPLAPPGGVGGTAIAVAADGRALATWSRDDGDGANRRITVEATRGTTSAPLEPAVTLSGTSNAQLPLAVLPPSAGESAVVWNDAALTGAFAPAAMPFGTPRIRARLGDSDSLDLRTARYDADGGLTIAYVNDASHGLVIRSRTGAVRRVSLPARTADEMALDGRGAVTTLVEDTGFKAQLGVRRRSRTGALSRVRQLQRMRCEQIANDDLVCSLLGQDLDVAASGYALATWCLEGRNRANLLRAAVRPSAAGQFSPRFLIRRVPDPSSCGPQAALGDRGDAVVTWVEKGRLKARWRLRAGRLGPIRDLGKFDDSAGSNETVIAVGRSGHFVLAWSTGGKLRVAAGKTGQPVGAPRTLEASEPDEKIAVGVDAQGRGLVLHTAPGGTLDAPQRTIRAWRWTP